MSAGSGHAADVAARILTFLAEQRGPATAAAIADSLAESRSTVYDALNVLREHAYVLHLPRERRWTLGSGVFALTAAYARQAPLSRLGGPIVAAMVDRVGESGHLAVLHGRDVLYVAEVRAPHRPYLVTDVGVRLPASLAASGRALLSALPPTQVRALYASPDDFVTRNGIGPTRYGELRSVLQQVRARGFATEDGDVTEGLASVAVPVLDPRGWPVAAVALTFVTERLADQERFVAEVVGAARAIARRLYPAEG